MNVEFHYDKKVMKKYKLFLAELDSTLEIDV